jgi:hypothetical protein
MLKLGNGNGFVDINQNKIIFATNKNKRYYFCRVKLLKHGNKYSYLKLITLAPMLLCSGVVIFQQSRLQ